MKAINADEMRKLEDFAVQAGIPKRILMENAGMKVAITAAHEVKHAKNAVIICGGGGNGGDGFVAARYLNSAGIKTEVFTICSPDKITSQESIANLEVIKRLNVPVMELSSVEASSKLKASLISADIIIDAIYGTGFHGEITDQVGGIIDLINSSRAQSKIGPRHTIISVDVPSGSDPTTGEVSSKCVDADVTVTFEYPKIGLLKYPASKYAGKVITTSIGIPKPGPIEKASSASQAKEKAPPKAKLEGIEVTDPVYVSNILPKYKVDINKSDRGKVLIIAGSSGMMGAAVLAANSAMRAGSGLVTLCVPDDIVNYVNTMSLETVVSGFASLPDRLSGSDAIALGPGLSQGKGIIKLVNSILMSKKVTAPLILDADALNAISDCSALKKAGKNIIITPHPGEFSRLTGRSVAEIQKDRMGHASRFAVKYGVTVVLKGAYTVIAGKDKKIFINPMGNPAMASAGVGDVLTGIITSFIGQGVTPFDAAVAGAYVHGMAGNLAASIKGEKGILAGDIIDSIPYTIGAII